MAKFERFEDIIAWQKGRKLVGQIYDATNNGKFSKDFGLRDQIRRASISVMLNIAEGFARRGVISFMLLKDLWQRRNQHCTLPSIKSISRKLRFNKCMINAQRYLRCYPVSLSICTHDAIIS